MVSYTLPAFALFSFVAFHAVRIIYRLFFHPLASVPGYKIAAATGFYENYWDVARSGRYMFRINDMHAKYGPIVRISPREVHISDPTYWDVLYNGTNRLDKDGRYYAIDGSNCTGVTTVSHEMHRRRRGAVAKFLSAVNVAKLEPQIQLKLKQLLDRCDEIGRAGEPIDCFNAFRSYTMDVISICTEPRRRNNLASPDFSKTLHRTLRGGSEVMALQRMIPFAIPVLEAIPNSVWHVLQPNFAELLDKREDLRVQAREVATAKGKVPDDRTPTMLDAMYGSELLSKEDKKPLRLAYELEVFLGAGTETTANTMAIVLFYVLTQPNIHKRLMDELLACSDAPRDALIDFRTLEKLPYFSAVIQEGLRMASPVSGRLPRVNPTSPMTYTTPGPASKTYTFPPGTVLSMSMTDLHFHADTFPEPKAFVPERWLPASDPTCAAQSPEHRREMDRFFVPFSRGSRNCVGMELARLELAATLGNLFRRFDLELFETTARDVEVAHDFFAPFGHDDSEGVRVKIRH